MNKIKAILILLTGLFFHSCGEKLTFNTVSTFYVDHISCGGKNYGIFEVNYANIKNFPKEMTDTLTIRGKWYENLVLAEVPDTLTGLTYGIDYDHVGKTKINCKELEHMSEVYPIRYFAYYIPQGKRPD
jgi:hypothetical protein